MTTKETLHHIIESLSEEDADRLLDWLNLQADPDELTEEEVADLERIGKEMEAGDYITLEEFKAKRGR